MPTQVDRDLERGSQRIFFETVAWCEVNHERLWYFLRRHPQFLGELRP